jgi:hypothetical protein
MERRYGQQEPLSSNGTTLFLTRQKRTVRRGEEDHGEKAEERERDRESEKSKQR